MALARRTAIVSAAVILVATLDSLLLGAAEMIGAALLMSCFVAPSAVLFLLCDRFLTDVPQAKHVVYFGSLLPLTALLALGLSGPDNEGQREWVMWLGTFYLTEAAAAYAALVLSARRKPE